MNGRETEQVTAALVGKISAMQDRRMRAVTLERELESHAPAALVEILHQLSQGCDRDLPGYRVAMLAVSDLVLSILNQDHLPSGTGDTGARPEGLSYDKIKEVYRLAREQGLDDVSRLFLGPGPTKRAEPEEIERDPRLEKLSLGERKQMARGRHAGLLDRLLYDADPQVIHRILRNPRTTEREVVRLAARRPNLEKVLREIYHSSRWISRYRVKRALVANPYSPPDIAIKLINFLMQQHLRELVQDGSLHPQVIEAARARLRRHGDGETRRHGDETR